MQEEVVVAFQLKESCCLKEDSLFFGSSLNLVENLMSPNLVKIHNATKIGDCFRITSQWCRDGSLRDLLKERSCLNESQVSGIMLDVAWGLCNLADMNILHRNLSLANIFIKEGRAKIGGLGFGKKVDHMGFDQVNYRTVDVANSCSIHMSPQAMLNHIYNHKTDVWCFGLILFELLHGYGYFAGCQPGEQLTNKMLKQIEVQDLRQNLSFGMKNVIVAALNIDEKQRPNIRELSHLISSYFGTNKKKLKDGCSTKSRRKELYKMQDQLEQFKLYIEQLDEQRIGLKEGKFKIRQSMDFIPSVHVLQNRFIQEQFYEKEEQAKQHYFFLDEEFVQTEENVQAEEQLMQKQPMTEQQLSVLDQFSFQLEKPTLKMPSSSFPVGRFNVIFRYPTYSQFLFFLQYAEMIVRFLRQYDKTRNAYLNSPDILVTWLSWLLWEVEMKVIRKQIIYEGEPKVREKALLGACFALQKQVQKIQEQIEMFEGQIFQGQLTYLDVKCHIYSIYCEIDGQISENYKKDCCNKPKILLGYQSMLILEATELLMQCYDKGNYEELHQYRNKDMFLKQEIWKVYSTSPWKLKGRFGLDNEQYMEQKKNIVMQSKWHTEYQKYK